MKILLFTDLPPCEDFSGGLVLAQIVRLLPPGSVVCFAATNPYLAIQRPADMDWMPMHFVDKPNELGMRHIAPFLPFPDLLDSAIGLYDRHVRGRRILKKALAFGQLHAVDAVMVMMQGQTVINLATPLATALKVPLYTLVWDPLIWWKTHNLPDPLTARVTLRAFDRALSASKAAATASWAMSQAYLQTYGLRSRPVIRSHDAALARQPAPRISMEGELIIAMAGQVYAVEETFQLIKALNACNWKIRDRQVRLRYFGKVFPHFPLPEERLKNCGWMDEAALIAALSECDILYCPYPSEAALEQVAKLSFPSKLVTYFAAGRPVIVHGPIQSSPARYVADRGAGVVAAQVSASSIFNAVDALVRAPADYCRAALGAQAAFQSDFTLERMKAALYDVLELQDAPLPVPLESVAVIDERRWEGLPANRWLKKKPPLAWRAAQLLGSSRKALINAVRARLSPICVPLQPVTAFSYFKYPPQTAEAGDIAFSTGPIAWDYVAALKLPDALGAARYLSIRATCAGEDLYAQLVDEDVNAVGERVHVMARRWWFRIWFDLASVPNAKFVMFQANAEPKNSQVTVHRATLFTPWPCAAAALRRRFSRQKA